MGEPKNKGGRPPLYKTPEEMQKVIDEYFEWCDNRAVRVWDDKEKKEIMVSDPAPYTMSGLARRLGMSRRALVDYKKKTEFLPTIKKARSRVEEDVETRMNDKRTFTAGLIFNLKNNFDWQDKQVVEQNDPATEGIKERIDEIDAKLSKQLVEDSTPPADANK